MKYFLITLVLVLAIFLGATEVLGQPSFPDEPEQAPLLSSWIALLFAGLLGVIRLMFRKDK